MFLVTLEQKGPSNSFPIRASSFTEDEVILKSTLVDVINKSQEWHKEQACKFKDAAKTLIAETENQQRAKVAKLKAVMDRQRCQNFNHKQIKSDVKSF